MFLHSVVSIFLSLSLLSGTLCGPLHTRQAVTNYQRTIAHIKTLKSATILTGGNIVDRPGNFVEPTIVAIDHSEACVAQELFAPVMLRRSALHFQYPPFSLFFHASTFRVVCVCVCVCVYVCVCKHYWLVVVAWMYDNGIVLSRCFLN